MSQQLQNNIQAQKRTELSDIVLIFMRKHFFLAKKEHEEEFTQRFVSSSSLSTVSPEAVSSCVVVDRMDGWPLTPAEWFAELGSRHGQESRGEAGRLRESRGRQIRWVSAVTAELVSFFLIRFSLWTHLTLRPFCISENLLPIIPSVVLVISRSTLSLFLLRCKHIHSPR